MEPMPGGRQRWSQYVKKDFHFAVESATKYWWIHNPWKAVTLNVYVFYEIEISAYGVGRPGFWVFQDIAEKINPISWDIRSVNIDKLASHVLNFDTERQKSALSVSRLRKNFIIRINRVKKDCDTSSMGWTTAPESLAAPLWGPRGTFLRTWHVNLLVEENVAICKS